MTLYSAILNGGLRVILAVGISAVILLVFGVAAFRDYHYEEGYNAAMKDLEAAEKDWWQDAEREVDSTRKQIWREEPKKGRWV